MATVAQLEARLVEAIASTTVQIAGIDGRIGHLDATYSQSQQYLKEIEIRLNEVRAVAATTSSMLDQLRNEGSKSHVKLLNGTIDVAVNRWLAIVIVAIVLGLCWLGYSWMNAPQDRVGEVLATVFNHTDGRTVADPKQEVSVIYGLNTPTDKTLKWLQDLKVPLDDEDVKAYTLEPNAIEDFEADLKQHGAQGFNRWEVWGSGTRPVKPMWQWSITWNRNSPITVQDVVAIYEKHFHRSKNIYIEETRVGKTKYSKE